MINKERTQSAVRMTDRSHQGRLIVFEGPDGVGKSTLSQALVKKLTEVGIPCEYLSFPGKEAGTIGHLIYELHHDPEAFGLRKPTAASLQALHIAAHLDAIQQRILPALRQGRWLVLDRFWWSTWVYGCVASVDKPTLNAMIQVERIQWRGIRPTVLFLIDRTKGSVHDHNWFQLRKVYLTLFEKERGKYPVCMLQNDRPVDESLSQLLETLRDFIPQVQSGISKLQSTCSPMLAKQSPLVPQSIEHPTVFARLSAVKPTVVYDTYWQFAAERQEVFYRKLEGYPAPWTTDPIIARHKFTNAYRASDRVSQYLIRNVIYEGEQTPQEVFFRSILFKLFNKIETWELLKDKLGVVSYADYSFSRYDRVLTQALLAGTRIYSAAYIMPSGKTSFGDSYKHGNHLKLLERMMEHETPSQIASAPSMRDAYEVLRSHPTIGSFLAYQFVTDLNYSELTDFSEMEFVVPGPGALDGIRKCFTDLGGLNEADTIRLVTERQERELERLGLDFRTLGGRRLQLIDCQNLFCEVSKYARLKHPDIKGVSNRTRIKQIYRPSAKAIEYWFPPKWGINQLMPRPGRSG